MTARTIAINDGSVQVRRISWNGILEDQARLEARE